MSAVYGTEQVAEMCDVSPWSLYQAVRRGDAPFPFIRVGRRIVWPRKPIDEALGIDSEESV